MKKINLIQLMANALETKATPYLRKSKHKYPGSENWSRSKYKPHYGKNAAARNLARGW